MIFDLRPGGGRPAPGRRQAKKETGRHTIHGEGDYNRTNVLGQGLGGTYFGTRQKALRTPRSPHLTCSLRSGSGPRLRVLIRPRGRISRAQCEREEHLPPTRPPLIWVQMGGGASVSSHRDATRSPLDVRRFASKPEEHRLSAQRDTGSPLPNPYPQGASRGCWANPKRCYSRGRYQREKILFTHPLPHSAYNPCDAPHPAIPC